MAKKSFIIYQNWAKLFENLEDEKAGMLIKAICAHVNGEKVEVQDVSINAIFQMIAEKITEDTARYVEVSQIRRDAVNKRWKDTKAYKSIQENTNVSASIQKNYDTDTDTDTKKEKETKRKFTPPTLEEIKAYCKERNSCVDAEKFFEYFDTGGWVDSKGNKVKNWKQKIITWEKYGGNRSSPQRPATKFINFEEREYNELDTLENQLARN